MIYNTNKINMNSVFYNQNRAGVILFSPNKKYVLLVKTSGNKNKEFSKWGLQKEHF